MICISLLISLPFITCPILPKKWGMMGKIELIQNFICMFNSDALFQCYVPASNLLYNIRYRIYSYENFSLRSHFPQSCRLCKIIQYNLELVILFLELVITWDGCDKINFVWKGPILHRHWKLRAQLWLFDVFFSACNSSRTDSVFPYTYFMKH